MTPIRVLHLIDSLDIGGAQEILLQLVRYSGPDVNYRIAALHGPGYLQDEFEALGVDVANLAPGRFHIPAMLLGLRRVIRETGPDVVNLHLEISTLMGLAFGPKGPAYAVSIHATRDQLPAWFYPLLSWSRLPRRAHGASTGLPHLLKREAVKVGFVDDRIIPVPIGTDYLERIETNKIPIIGVRKEFGIPSSAPVIINVARMHPRKGQVDLVIAISKVLARIPEAVLILVGDGPEMDKIRKLVASMGLGRNVILPGYRRDLENFYADADIFVMPSLDAAMGVVVLQAMAFQLPVVAYETGPVSYYHEHDVTGLLTPAGETDSLAQALEKLILNPDLARRFGRTGRNRVEKRFSSRAMAEAYTSFYKNCVKNVGINNRGV